MHENEQILQSFMNILKKEINTSFSENINKLLKKIYSENLFRKIDLKCFVYDDYENLHSSFLRAIEQFMHSFFSCLKGNSFEERMFERFINKNILIFKSLEDKNNMDELLESSLNDKINEFFFSMLTDQKTIQENLNFNVDYSLNFSDDFLNLIKTNFKILLLQTHPKFQNLIKFYFNLIILKDFKFITETICENRFNFDFLADLFFNKISTLKISLNSASSSGSLLTGQIKIFIVECCTSPEKIVLLFILLERSTVSKIQEMIDLISQIFLKNIINFTNKSVDAIINQIKIANLIIFNILDNKVISISELDKIIKIIHMYLCEKQINIVKEIVNLLGLIVKLISQSLNQNQIQIQKGNYKGRIFAEEIKDFYFNIQSRFFPIKTKYIKINTK